MIAGTGIGFGSITPRELSERLSRGDRLQVIDVREPFELQIAAIPGACHIPLRTLPGRLGEVARDRPVVVVCHHGVRSASACGWLVREGCLDVHNLSGGIDAWSTDVDRSVPRY